MSCGDTLRKELGREGKGGGGRRAETTTRRTTHHCGKMARRTLRRHCSSSAAAAGSWWPAPTSRMASGMTVRTHSFLGRPTFRTYLSVAGVNVPGTKVASLIEEFRGCRNTLPSTINCLRRSCTDAASVPARCNTDALETRDKKDGLILRTLRRHLAWNPSNLRSSAFVKHAAGNAYNNLDSTNDLNTASRHRRDSEECLQT